MIRENIFSDLSENSIWRYERKFAISSLSKFEIESIIKLHPMIFSEIFYERVVNNIYLDSMNFDNYWENLIGNSQRLKIRIRWYNDTFGQIEEPKMEIKIKSGFLGNKISYPMMPFYLDQNVPISNIIESIKKSEIHDNIKIEILNLKFAIMNLYNRKYFLSADKKFRLTIDTDMQYFKINDNFNSFLCKNKDLSYSILELKYNREFDDSVAAITNWFLFRLTRNSKYINGIEKLIIQ